MKHIFQHRIESASQRLASLDAVLNRMDLRANDVRSLRDELANQRGQITETLGTLNNRIDNIIQGCNESNPDVNYIRSTAALAQQHLIRLMELIAGARAKAAGISCVQLDPTALTKRNQEFKTKLERGRAQLDNIREEGPGVTPWTHFRDVNDTWIEYLDYLAGLCLRHEGVDEGVCEIADALISECERNLEGLGALAIPGRESGAGTLPRAVYLRFPEWTLWALPLATRELWHIARKEAFVGQNFPNYAERWRRENEADIRVADLRDEKLGPRLHECLADVFATYVMGPAYACAALLLALDPLRGVHRERAAMILSTLERLGAPDKPSADVEVPLVNKYAAVHGRLYEHWHDAVAEAGATEEGSEFMAQWVEAFSTYLDKYCEKIRFPTHRWAPIRDEWADKLHQGLVDDIPIQDATVRFALNVAWKVRLEHPLNFQDISEPCTQLCRRIMHDAAFATRFAASPAVPGPGSAPNLAK
jgi:hypothetical protein